MCGRVEAILEGGQRAGRAAASPGVVAVVTGVVAVVVVIHQ